MKTNIRLSNFLLPTALLISIGTPSVNAQSGPEARSIVRPPVDEGLPLGKEGELDINGADVVDESQCLDSIEGHFIFRVEVPVTSIKKGFQKRKRWRTCWVYDEETCRNKLVKYIEEYEVPYDTQVTSYKDQVVCRTLRLSLADIRSLTECVGCEDLCDDLSNVDPKLKPIVDKILSEGISIDAGRAPVIQGQPEPADETASSRKRSTRPTTFSARRRPTPILRQSNDSRLSRTPRRNAAELTRIVASPQPTQDPFYGGTKVDSRRLTHRTQTRFNRKSIPQSINSATPIARSDESKRRK